MKPGSFSNAEDFGYKGGKDHRERLEQKSLDLQRRFIERVIKWDMVTSCY